MLFKGRLRLPSDPGEGIPIDLELEDVILSLVSEGEDFGEWRLDKVEIRRLFSNQFALLLDGEEMVFVADDALGFAYDGLTFVEDVTGRLSKRRLFKGRKSSKRQPSEVEPEPEAADVALPIDQERIPDVVPFFPEPVESAAPGIDAAIVEAPRAPVGRQMSDLVGDEPEDAEVVSMMHPIEVAPAMPGEITPDMFAPQSDVPELGVEAVEPAPVTAAEAPAAISEPVPSVREAVSPAADLADGDDEEAELVIEDVAAYGYVPPVATRSAAVEPTAPTPRADVPIEPIVEEVESPAARAAEVHPLGEVASAPVVPAGTASLTEDSVGESPSTEQLADPDTDGPTIELDVGDFEEEQIPAALRPTLEEMPVAEPHPEEIKDFAWSSNGHAEVSEVAASNGVDSPNGEVADEPDDASQTQKSGRHARSEGRSKSGSLFGRRKSREPEAHEHRYESSKTVGGITRSICAVCDHVSFAGEDVYQGW